MGEPTVLTPDEIPGIRARAERCLGPDWDPDLLEVADLLVALDTIEALRAELAEAPQPRVLWRGETTGSFKHGSVARPPKLDVPNGTRVAVIEDTETPG